MATETVRVYVDLDVPTWMGDQGRDAVAMWHDEIVPALLLARQARARSRQRRLDDAAEVVASVVGRLGGLDPWHGWLLLEACADVAGVGLPLSPDDFHDPYAPDAADEDDAIFEEWPS